VSIVNEKKERETETERKEQATTVEATDHSSTNVHHFLKSI
jgi:hypothetical protein